MYKHLEPTNQPQEVEPSGVPPDPSEASAKDIEKHVQDWSRIHGKVGLLTPSGTHLGDGYHGYHHKEVYVQG